VVGTPANIVSVARWTPGGDQLQPRMAPDDSRKFAGIEQILAVHMPDAGLERRIVQKQQRRPARRRVQQHQIEPADFSPLIERPGTSNMGGQREGGAHQFARVVIAGKCRQKADQDLPVAYFYSLQLINETEIWTH
jgi:hypothetical protein